MDYDFPRIKSEFNRKTRKAEILEVIAFIVCATLFTIAVVIYGVNDPLL